MICMIHSVTELAKSGSDGARSVRAVLERHVVARAPRELRAKTSVDTVLDVGLGSDVTNLLLRRLEGLHSRVELVVLEHGHLLNIAHVPHRLQLIQVLRVVDEVEHEVVLHGNVKSLHGLSLTTSPGDGRINAILRLHEALVLVLDLINNVWSVDVGAVSIPVDGPTSTASLLLVVVVEETRKLAVGVT